MEKETNRPPRIRRTPEQIKSLLTEQAKSGKPVVDFAAEKGIPLSTLWGWRRRHRSVEKAHWIEVGNGTALMGAKMATVHVGQGVDIDLCAGFEIDPIAGLIQRLRKG